MDHYRITKKLGEGVMGKVYLARYNHESYALKIQRINKYDTKENYKSSLWREIEFSNFTKNYPDQFIILHEYNIIDDSEDFPNIKKLNDEEKKDFNIFFKSQYCVIFAYSIKDGNFKDILKKLSDKQFFSMLIQMSYIMHLLIENGYRHNDIHYQNVMYKKCDKNKTLKILEYVVPTYGYIFCLVDYGLIAHKKYNLRPSEKFRLVNRVNDLDVFMNGLKHKPITKLAIRKDLEINYDILLDKIKKEEEYDDIKKYLLDGYPETNRNIMVNMMLVMNEKKILKLMNVEKYSKYFDKYDIFQKMDKKDFLYIWKNITEPEKIINYFYKKL